MRGAAHGGPQAGRGPEVGRLSPSPWANPSVRAPRPLGLRLARALAPFPRSPIRRILGHVSCGLLSLVPPSVLRAFPTGVPQRCCHQWPGSPGCVLGDNPGGPSSPGLLASPDKSALTCPTVAGEPLCQVDPHLSGPGLVGLAGRPAAPLAPAPAERPPGGPHRGLLPLAIREAASPRIVPARFGKACPGRVEGAVSFHQDEIHECSSLGDLKSAPLPEDLEPQQATRGRKNGLRSKGGHKKCHVNMQWQPPPQILFVLSYDKRDTT